MTQTFIFRAGGRSIAGRRWQALLAGLSFILTGHCSGWTGCSLRSAQTKYYLFTRESKTHDLSFFRWARPRSDAAPWAKVQNQWNLPFHCQRNGKSIWGIELSMTDAVFCRIYLLVSINDKAFQCQRFIFIICSPEANIVCATIEFKKWLSSMFHRKEEGKWVAAFVHSIT